MTSHLTVRTSSAATWWLAWVNYISRLLHLTQTPHFAFSVIIFGKQIWCTQISHHDSLPWRDEGWGTAGLLPPPPQMSADGASAVAAPSPLLLSCPESHKHFLMNELGLFCTRRCTSLRVLHLVSPLTLHGQAWLLSWKHIIFCALCHLILLFFFLHHFLMKFRAYFFCFLCQFRPYFICLFV